MGPINEKKRKTSGTGRPGTSEQKAHAHGEIFRRTNAMTSRDKTKIENDRHQKWMVEKSEPSHAMSMRRR